MLILGFSSLDRDVAVALMRDGDVVAAIENDKLTRSKTRGLPDDAIQFCLKQGGVDWKDLDAVAIASQPARGWMRRSFLRARMAPFSAAANTYYEVNELGLLARELNL
ncbi:MAG TPA: carbamoyltransferase N-terminal domain-containing protein, partial [Terriglobales bacterium]|nr:carbamoyltransferase N-terminal domain-containing protein [Terriglobales bacterium]